MANYVIEIARQEGAELRSVRLTLEDDGAIELGAQDIGPNVTTFWGEDAYEFWVRAGISRLPLLLLPADF